MRLGEMQLTPRRLLRGGGFYEYAARFSLLLPLAYAGVRHLGLAGEKPAPAMALATGATFGLLALHLEVEVRSMARAGERLHAAMGARLLGKTPAEVEDVATSGEAAPAANLRKGQARGVVWADPARKHRTSTCVVMLHGWSGSRREISPICEDIAKELGANCYFARLPGHGRERMAWKEEEMTLHSFVQEVCEAFAIGQALGERVVIVGASTGAALLTWLTAQPWSKSDVRGCVLLCPNVWTNPVALISTVRRVPLLRDVAISIKRGWIYHLTPVLSPEHKEAWTNIYPTHTMLAVFDVSAALALHRPEENFVPTLAFHNPQDPTASFDEARSFISRLPKGRFVPVLESEHKHCLAGSILSPSKVEPVKAEIIKWLKELN